MGLRDYVGRVREAKAKFDTADAELHQDDETRKRNGGPWDEDEKYLRLNAAAYDAREDLRRTVRGR